MSLLIVILESADPELIEQLCNQGKLPWLNQFCKHNNQTVIDVEPGLYTVGTWFNMSIGASVASHEQHSWTQYDRFNDRLKHLDPQQTADKTIFSKLDKSGVKQFLMDVPRLPLLKLENGQQVIDWYNHDFVADGVNSHPGSLADEINQRFGIDPFLGNCDQCDVNDFEQETEFLVALTRRIKNKTAFCVEQMQHSLWDLFVVNFSDPHCGGHRLWHVHDVNHKNFQLRGDTRSLDPMVALYRHLDQAIATLTAHWQGEVAIVANLGMQSNHANNALLDIALDRFNIKAPQGRSSRRAKGSIPVDAPLNGTRISRSLPVSDSEFAVRVRVLGRDKGGVVSTGRELESYLDELVQEFMALRSIPTNEPLLSEFRRFTHCDQGSHIHNLPDVTFSWHEAPPVDVACSPYLGMIMRKQRRKRTGTHRPIGHCWSSQTEVSMPSKIKDSELTACLLNSLFDETQ